jgi:hypothetical protein
MARLNLLAMGHFESLKWPRLGWSRGHIKGDLQF